MNGYRAYQHYLALKKHFTTEKFNVMETPRVLIPEATFVKRNDRWLWEKLAQTLPGPELLEYMVANVAMGFPGFVYDHAQAGSNYNAWIKNKQSRTRNFENAASIICDELDSARTLEAWFEFDGHSPPILLNKLMSGEFPLDVVSIFDQSMGLSEKWEKVNSSLFAEQLLLIKKVKPFVKFNKEKISTVISGLV